MYGLMLTTELVFTFCSQLLIVLHDVTIVQEIFIIYGTSYIKGRRGHVIVFVDYG